MRVRGAPSDVGPSAPAPRLTLLDAVREERQRQEHKRKRKRQERKRKRERERERGGPVKIAVARSAVRCHRCREHDLEKVFVRGETMLCESCFDARKSSEALFACISLPDVPAREDTGPLPFSLEGLDDYARAWKCSRSSSEP